MKFDSFVGNDKVKEDISALFAAGRLPHAIIIEGEMGLGKRTLARIIAAALVCRGEDKPCGECNQCRKAAQNIHPDIFEYIPAGGAKSFHIETVRSVINDCAIQPNEAPYKVYILCNAHLMGPAAQNALLKILEEPPSYAVFILTARSKSEMLSTVLSRSVVFTLEDVDVSKGAEYIASVTDGVSTADASKALISTGGNIGSAIKELTDDKAGELVKTCDEMCKGIVSNNEYDLLKACAAFQRDRQGIADACDILKLIFRDALLISQGGQVLSGSESSARLLARSLTPERLLALIDTVGDIKKQALTNVNNSLIITKLCYSLRRQAGR